MANQSYQDVQNQYGGIWRNAGLGADMGEWYRAPRIDPMAQAVWNPEYGWQDAGQLKRLKGDYSSLKPQFGSWEDYFMAKPEGTSDPELRQKHGRNWMDYFAGSDFFRQYAQHQGAMDKSNPWYGRYGADSGWSWGNEAAGSKFNPYAFDWYTGEQQ